MSRRYVATSLSGKSAGANGLRGSSLNEYVSRGTATVGLIGIKTRVIDAIIIPFMSQNWKTLEENMFLIEVIKEEIDEILSRNPQEDITIYKDLMSVIELSFLQQQEITSLEKRLYEGRNDVITMVVKLDSIRMKPELELYDLILGKPDYKRSAIYDATIVEEILRLMKIPRATFSNISSFIKNKYSLY